MNSGFTNESMLDIFIYETSQNIEQLEQTILSSEKASSYSPETVNEIFRIMHTIKGSAAMMLYNNIAALAHVVEDLFYFIRDEKSETMDCTLLSDLVLESVDFIKVELEKVKNSDSVDGDPASLVDSIKEFLTSLKGKDGGLNSTSGLKKVERASAEPKVQQYFLSPDRSSKYSNKKTYEAVIHFKAGCEMENIRAYTIIHNLKEIEEDFYYTPEEIIEDNDSVEVIREQGFKIVLRSDKSFEALHSFFIKTAFIERLELVELEAEQESGTFAVHTNPTVLESPLKIPKIPVIEQADKVQSESKAGQQSFISVDVMKLDKLMDLMGELVIAEAMVTQNPELRTMQLNNFYKAARQLRKITSEMQDMVMSIRMVPLAATFQKMHRIVRDMSRKLNKEVQLTLLGEETEVDKNIIEHIADPLMHLVRNSIDHGIEDAVARAASSKPKVGQVTLEAKNSGNNVLVIVRDDGKGLNKEKILQKARKQGLLSKPAQEMSDKEIYNLIFLPGFSTTEHVTEFSGRGVGMDVVIKNLEDIGGSVSIDSIEGTGTVTTLKIPLTLAIIDGMNIRVGTARYTLPTISIKETFRANLKDVIKDPDNNEMILVRGECHPILRLHRLFNVKNEITDFAQGIMLMVEQDGKSICLFADELLGQHQVVVKALPDYIRNTKRIEGLAGCTLLGDGSISLILNIGGLLGMV